MNGRKSPDGRGPRYSELYVAMICHDALAGMTRVHELMLGPDADAAPDTAPLMHLHPDLRDAAVNGVIQVRRGMTSPADLHGEWVRFLADRGWDPGPRDPAARTHPHMVRWAELPLDQQDKNRIFIALVVNLSL